MTIVNKPTELKRTPLWISEYFIPEFQKLWETWSANSDEEVYCFENIEWLRITFREPESIPSYDSSCEDLPDGEVMQADFEMLGLLPNIREIRLIGSVEYYYQPNDEAGTPKIMSNIVAAEKLNDFP
jgi:hypothetical protein